MDQVTGTICQIRPDEEIGFQLFDVANRTALVRTMDEESAQRYATQCGHKVVPYLTGYHADHTLPAQRGDVVIIPKGTMISTTYPGKAPYPAGRTYRVRVHHTMPGSEEPWSHKRISDPQVCWPGAGSYWCDANITEVINVDE